jgi:hypothetical protein
MQKLPSLLFTTLISISIISFAHESMAQSKGALHPSASRKACGVRHNCERRRG